MMKELHTADVTPEIYQKKKSHVKRKAVPFNPPPADPSLIPLLSSSDDDGGGDESPSNMFFKQFSSKPTYQSDVSLQNVKTVIPKNCRGTTLKSPKKEKSATNRKRRISSSVKQEMLPQNFDILHKENTFQNSSSPAKQPKKKASPMKQCVAIDSPNRNSFETSSPKKKVQSSKKMTTVGDLFTRVDIQPEIPTQPLSWQPIDADQLTQFGEVTDHQVDSGDQSNDSSESSSLSDSSEEDKSVPTVGIQCKPEDGVRGEEKEIDVEKMSSQIRFKAPEHYTECNVQNEDLNEEDAADCDLWLIKVPYDFDVAGIDKKCVTVGGALMVKRTTEKDGACRVWEMEASRDKTLEASNWSVFLPSKTHNKLCPVGPLKGQICLTKSIQSLPYVLPPVPTKHVHMPEGLRMRNVPFGADTPECRKMKKKKNRLSRQADCGNVKKHKKKRYLEQNENTTDVLKEETTDWTTVKHHKKHKTHKKHPIKVER